MKIEITDAEGTIEQIRAAVVAELITAHRTDLDMISPMQACGLLDITPKALGALGLDKVDVMGNGRVIRYRLADVKALMAERTTKALPAGKTRRKRRAA